MNNQANTPVHPICTNSPDQNKCSEFVERLESAYDNTPIREDSSPKHQAK